MSAEAFAKRPNLLAKLRTNGTHHPLGFRYRDARAARRRQTANDPLETDAGPVKARVDPSVMVQVLENPVSNAMEYPPAGKRILVGLRRTPGD